jgi:hypothetical protein
LQATPLGLVLYFKPDGRYAGGYHYINGTLVTPATAQGNARSINRFKATTAENSTPPTEVDCEETDLNTYEDGELVSSVYLYTVCSDGSNPNGSGGSSPAPPPCTTPTTGGSDPTDPNDGVETIYRSRVAVVQPPPTPAPVGGDGDGGVPAPPPAP